MNDLISRQAAIDILEVAINDDWEFDYAKDRMIELSTQPEIIRCKECKFYEQPEYRIYENCVRWKDSNGILLPINPDDFCSRAERKDGEADG